MARRIEALPIKDVAIKGPFWGRYMDLVRREMIPFQWEVLNDRADDAPKSHCIANFEIAAGRRQGEFYGMVFQDSDLYKWLECVAYSLATYPDSQLENLADNAIRLIGDAQCPDGYINTYFTIKEPTKRWVNLVHGHELYCAGHLIEAAAAYYDATGKTAFLDIAVRFADYIDNIFGLEEGKLNGYPGHQEIELALFKLYKITKEKRYLNLAAYFIKERGKEPNYFEVEGTKPEFFEIFPEHGKPDWTYSQSHMPPVKQSVAVGHAVRAVYMYSAMADLAAELNDKTLSDACDALYEDITTRQMYVTGAIGSAAWGEKFTTAYDLPNDSIYGETCASVGLMMFSRRMNILHGGAEYADTMERALYNTVLAGMSLTGKNFFYVNPLEVDPKKSRSNPNFRHIKPVRPKWFSCACCPANLARTITGLGLYAYGATTEGLYVNLYCEGEAKSGGRKIEVTTAYPFGNVANIVASGGRFKLNLRNPQAAPVKSIKVDSQPVEITTENGYITLEYNWQGQQIELQFDMTPKFIYTAGQVQTNVGKAAIMSGPIVYCAEEVDNGPMLGSYVLNDKMPIAHEQMPCGLLPDGTALLANAYKHSYLPGGLYRTEKPDLQPCTLRFIPYFLWANRGENEMRVFLPHTL